MTRHAEVVDGEAHFCRNISGTSKRRFRMASLAIKAGMRVLLKRAENPPALTEQRIAALKWKVRRIVEVAKEKDAEVAELRKQLEELRNFKATMATGLSPHKFQRYPGIQV